MNTQDFIKKYYLPSVIVCSVLLVLAVIAGGIAFVKGSQHYMTYKSSIEVDATITFGSAIEWTMLDPDMPHPGDGDRVKIISVYQPAEDRYTNRYECALIYLEDGKPIGYASGVKNSYLRAVGANYETLSNLSKINNVAFHRGISEQVFFAALFTVISIIVYLIFNLPAMVYLAHKDYFAQSKYATSAVVNIILILFAVAEVLIFLGGL